MRRRSRRLSPAEELRRRMIAQVTMLAVLGVITAFFVYKALTMP